MTSLLSRRAPLAKPDEQLKTLEALPLAREFHEALKDSSLTPFQPTRLDIFQINVGKLCNQTCRHCHVDAGPDRKEMMARDTMELCLQAIAKTDIATVDITGGAPELHPHFEWFVTEVKKLGRHVMDRCNLTIIETPARAHLPRFFADNQVEVVCSLPHFRATNTDAQRGEGVFDKSISALKKLNAVGYGKGTGLRLVLVTNPVGAFLPTAQASLEREWKRELESRYGIAFDALYCLTNMPISRYLEWLIASGNYEAYMERLVTSYNPAAAANVMCRNTISVGWDGKLYDCDFNQMLDLEVDAQAPRHIRDFDKARLERRTIVTHRHCFGCTAGAGSSCGGATT